MDPENLVVQNDTFQHLPRSPRTVKMGQIKFVGRFLFLCVTSNNAAGKFENPYDKSFGKNTYKKTGGIHTSLTTNHPAQARQPSLAREAIPSSYCTVVGYFVRIIYIPTFSHTPQWWVLVFNCTRHPPSHSLIPMLTHASLTYPTHVPIGGST